MLRVALLSSLVATACLVQPARGPESYFPLRVGKAWAYRVLADGTPTEGLVQVLVSDATSDVEGREVYVVSRHDGSVPPADRVGEPTFYEVVPGKGIYCQVCEAYLLEAPMEKGHTWPAGGGDGAGLNRVLSTSATIKVGDRSFRDCLIVDRGEPSRRIEFAYAPMVGLIRTRFYRSSTAADAYREEILVGFGEILTDPPQFLRPLE